jgi:hypothetical protein
LYFSVQKRVQIHTSADVLTKRKRRGAEALIIQTRPNASLYLVAVVLVMVAILRRAAVVYGPIHDR